MKMINEIVTLPNSCSNSLSLSVSNLDLSALLPAVHPSCSHRRRKVGACLAAFRDCRVRNPLGREPGNRQVLGASLRSFPESHREVAPVPVAHFHIWPKARSFSARPQLSHMPKNRAGKGGERIPAPQNGSRGATRSHNLGSTACFPKHFYSSSQTKIQQLSSLKTL